MKPKPVPTPSRMGMTGANGNRAVPKKNVVPPPPCSTGSTPIKSPEPKKPKASSPGPTHGKHDDDVIVKNLQKTFDGIDLDGDDDIQPTVVDPRDEALASTPAEPVA